MDYIVIYDGKCNLCANFVQILRQFDQGQRFEYVPMQDEATLRQWQVTPADCEQGMMLIHREHPDQRWQGSDAAEEISRLLPGGGGLVRLYRSMPTLKSWGDRLYAQIRDHRYDWFGERSELFRATPESSPEAAACTDDACATYWPPESSASPSRPDGQTQQQNQTVR